jgi:two-component system sensor histidine kinase ChvG
MFLPITGVLYLDLYEKRLLEAQEREMVQQARVLSAVLAETAEIDAALVQRTFARLERRTEARLRVFDAAGGLLADSAKVPGVPSPPDSVSPYPAASGTRERVLYRLGAWFVSARDRIGSSLRRLLGKRQPSVSEAADTDAPIKEALSGRYGAATVPTPGQRSLTLVSAVPVRHGERVIGAVVVSQSTFRLLQTLYQIRLRIFEIVLLSIVAAALLTAVAATRIVRPLKQLRRRAAALAERHSPLPSTFPGVDRRDEIGALARSLDVLTRRLTDHIGRLESFAADVAHEFRNPLASIRTAADTISESTDPAERERFLLLMRQDVDRLDRLVAGVREMATIDGQLEQQPVEAVDLRELFEVVMARLRITATHPPSLVLRNSGDPIVRGQRERLEQAFENVLANGVSLSPPGTSIDIRIEAGADEVSVSIEDRGPGIPDAHLSRIFDRFFSYRPGGQRREHVGLGLAIARQIVEGYGGTITARNRPGGGATFEIVLPRTAEPPARTAITAQRAGT